MAKTDVHTANAPRPAGPYSQGIVANGLMYTAGFGPQDPADGNAVADADRARCCATSRPCSPSAGSPSTTA